MQPRTVILLIGLSLVPLLAHAEEKGSEAGAGKKQHPYARPGDPSRVQTESGFSVWTVAQKEANRYVVVVEIDVPKGTESLPASDLRGSFLTGSDGFRQNIPNSKTKEIPVIDGRAQLAVLVPNSEGGKKKVQDTLTLKSKLLGKSHTFTLATSE
jgi:hypothetical protein